MYYIIKVDEKKLVITVLTTRLKCIDGYVENVRNYLM